MLVRGEIKQRRQIHIRCLKVSSKKLSSRTLSLALPERPVTRALDHPTPGWARTQATRSLTAASRRSVVDQELDPRYQTSASRTKVH